MVLNAERAGETGVADAARLCAANVPSAVGKEPREEDTVAPRKDVRANANSKHGTARPSQCQSHVVDRTKYLVALGERNRVCRIADHLLADETSLGRAVQKRRRAESQCPRLSHGEHASNERKAAGRQKRGGNLQGRSFDFAQAEEELLAGADYPDADLDRFFHREWVRSLFSLAVEELRGRCRESNKNLSFLLFQRYDLERASSDAAFTYEELAQEFQLPITQVTNHLAYARREFRRIVLEKLRATTASEEEFRAEARQLLGGAAS